MSLEIRPAASIYNVDDVLGDSPEVDIFDEVLRFYDMLGDFKET